MATKNFYAIDSYDKLFCKCDGAGTSFSDSSFANVKTITANGNATQLSAKFNKSAGFFNGSTDKLIVPASTDFVHTYGVNGDFTYEVFANFNTSTQNTYFFERDSGNFGIRYYSGNLYAYIGGSGAINASWTPTVGTWYHLAMRRSGNSVNLYVDGISIASGTSTANVTCSSVMTLGWDQVNPTFSGWLKEARVSKIARTVSVPTTEYTPDANTVLLMHFDTPATSPLGPSIYFNGSAYLTVPNTSDLDFGTGDFTLDATARFDTTTGEKCFLSKRNGSTGWAWSIDNSVIYFYKGNTYKTFSFTRLANVNYAFRIVRSGNNLRAFVNGVQVGTDQDITGNNYDGLADTCKVGGDITGTTSPMLGSLREVRISKGIARDGGTAYTPAQNGFTVDSYTSLYIKGNENNGATTILDYCTSPKTVTNVSSTAVIKYQEDYRSCIFKDETGKFPYPQGSAKVDFFALGSGVGFMDGTNSLCYTSSYSADFDMPADYTLEGYVRWKAYTGNQSIIERYTDANATLFRLISDGTNLIFRSNAVETYLAWTPVLNTWYHVSGTRSGSSTRLFVNGTQLGSTGTESGAISGSTVVAFGGGKYSSGYEHYFNGLLDNIRISKGVARYTSSFNPPEARTSSGFLTFFI